MSEDIVSAIKKEEEQAQKTIEKAKVEAKHILEKAKIEAEELVLKAKNQAEAEANTRMREEKIKAQKQAERIIQEAQDIKIIPSPDKNKEAEIYLNGEIKKTLCL